MMDVRVKDALDHIAYLLVKFKVERNDFANTGANSQAGLLATMVKELEKIQDKLIGQ